MKTEKKQLMVTIVNEDGSKETEYPTSLAYAKKLRAYNLMRGRKVISNF